MKAGSQNTFGQLRALIAPSLNLGDDPIWWFQCKELRIGPTLSEKGPDFTLKEAGIKKGNAFVFCQRELVYLYNVKAKEEYRAKVDTPTIIKKRGSSTPSPMEESPFFWEGERLKKALSLCLKRD